ncbi:MAG: type II toxin-antitoxin system VapC family toxin [Aestuariivirga sp.]
MILLDTNVISEQMRPLPSEQVLRWFDGLVGTPLFLSTVTEAELLRGIANMPHGKARTIKAALLDEILREDFKGWILPFDSKAAGHYAEIFAHVKKIGRPISVFDCMIASIAKANDCQLATRNVADFEHCGVEIIDPWREA